MIKYNNRYSNDNNPDDMGRWARIASYKDIRIAWIQRIESNDIIRYSVVCHFPTMANDMANEIEICESIESAKEFIEERWEWFLEKIKQ